MAPRNVLLITTDQHRVDAMGAYGNPVIQTPNLDRLAAEGTRWTGCRTNHPFCQPARATILTGQYSTTHGVTFNGIDLPEDAVEQSVATRFGEAGYRTGYFGKAHFASTYPYFPTGKLESVEGSASMPEGWTGPYFGFEYLQLILFGHNMRMAPLAGLTNWCFGPAPMGLHYGRWLYRDGVERGNERLRLMSPEAAGAMWDHTQTWRNALPEEDHPTTWTTERTIDWLKERRADEPFMAWVSYTDPHHPFDPPDPWFDHYDPADVAEVMPERDKDDFTGKPPVHGFWPKGAQPEMAWANSGGSNFSDKQLAQTIAAYYGMITQIDHNIGRILDTLEEQGLAEDTLVIMSTDHGEYLGDHNMIFKGPLHYSGLLDVALIARGPGVEAGKVIDDPVGTIDLQPTMLSWAGLAVPEYCEGEVLPGFAGGTSRESVMTEDDFDVMVQIPLRTITTDRYRLTLYFNHLNQGELYDLQEDPGEFTNVWDDPAYLAIRTDLAATLQDQIRPLQRKLDKVGLVG